MIPPCACGQRRVFECQLLPTVLMSMQPATTGDSGVTDKLMECEWETLIVYCCPDSCDGSAEEFVIVR